MWGHLSLELRLSLSFDALQLFEGEIPALFTAQVLVKEIGENGSAGQPRLYNDCLDPFVKRYPKEIGDPIRGSTSNQRFLATCTGRKDCLRCAS